MFVLNIVSVKITSIHEFRQWILLYFSSSIQKDDDLCQI